MVFSSDVMFVVRVTHWQTLQSKNIVMTSSLTNFLVSVRTSFSEDITLNFRLYQLPHNFTSIQQRVLIKSEQSYHTCLSLFQDLSNDPPLLYVWNEDASPEKLPELKEELDRSDTRSNVSRDSTNPRRAKKRDNEKCLVCSMEGVSNLDACHIFERKHYMQLTEQLRELMLNNLALNSIDEIQNLITMCKQCHGKFDSHSLGIDPEKMSLIVTNLVRDKISNPYTKVPYQNLHGNVITQSEHIHKRFSEKAVKHRFETYFSKHNKDKHYCPICDHISQTMREHGLHLEASNCCRITKTVTDESNEENDIVAKLSLLTIDESAIYESFKETFMIDSKKLNTCSNKELKAFLLSKKCFSSGND